MVSSYRGFLRSRWLGCKLKSGLRHVLRFVPCHHMRAQFALAEVALGLRDHGLVLGCGRCMCVWMVSGRIVPLGGRIVVQRGAGMIVR